MIKSKDNFWPYICASAVPRGTAHEPIFTDLKKKSFSGPSPPTLPHRKGGDRRSTQKSTQVNQSTSTRA